MGLAEDIKQKALELGFDLVGITAASPIDDRQVALLADWLICGYAGQMDYMNRNFEKRIDPAKLVENARSVICVGLNYKPPTIAAVPTGPAGRIADYAQYEDYHPFMKNLLRKLVAFIGARVEGDFKYKICVDSAPLAERALAARAGLGFVGKNHMLINPDLGPQILLAEIVTTVELEGDEPTTEDCAGCNRCMEACPTGALRADGQFDANKCISYLTIEHKDEVPADLPEKIGDHLFGCNECVLACPYQQKAPVRRNEQFKFYDDRARLDLGEVLNLRVEAFEARFADSAINRLGLERVKRNARICLANVTKKAK
ncbi:MAG: tRNA epoxyqueuosine(34) reductase QueG [Planctomycetota bacterium]|jgi:epoxyqueuosine reductase